MDEVIGKTYRADRVQAGAGRDMTRAGASLAEAATEPHPHSSGNDTAQPTSPGPAGSSSMAASARVVYRSGSSRGPGHKRQAAPGPIRRVFQASVGTRKGT